MPCCRRFIVTSSVSYAAARPAERSSPPISAHRAVKHRQDLSCRVRKQKNPQGLTTLRIAPASSPSPFPQPTRERRSDRAGFLTSGSFYSSPFPSGDVNRESLFVKRRREVLLRLTFDDSRITSARQWFREFRPQLQRRDREGVAPSSLHPGRICGVTLRDRRECCQGERARWRRCHRFDGGICPSRTASI
jgi:hypothetical protein